MTLTDPHPLVLVAVFFAVLWSLITALLLLHEWGHVIAMRRLGMRVDRVVIGVVRLFTLQWKGLPYEFGLLPVLGYCASREFEKADTNRRAWVALAGPAATALTGAAFAVAWFFVDHWLLAACVQGSLVLLATNIIPLPPMDGWTVAEHFLHRRGVVLTAEQRKHLFYIGAGTIVLIALVI